MPESKDWITLKGVDSSGTVISEDVYTKSHFDSSFPVLAVEVSSNQASFNNGSAIGNGIRSARILDVTNLEGGPMRAYYLDSVSADGSEMIFVTLDSKKKATVSITAGTITVSDI